MKIPSRIFCSCWLGAMILAAVPRPASGQTTLTTLAAFDGGNGYYPVTGPILASDGNLYGTTPAYGEHGGTVYRITPSGTLTNLFSFGQGDGGNPLAALVQAQDGFLYGTTAGGDASTSSFSTHYGTVFRIGLDGSFKTLFVFPYDTINQFWPQGFAPEAALFQAADGNLYGTTAGGGTNNASNTPASGTIFKMSTAGDLLSSVSVHGPDDGSTPNAPFVAGPDGGLYSTAYAGGGGSSSGAVYRSAGGAPETVLHGFTDTPDGAKPNGGLVLGRDLNFYGSTQYGGGSHLGTVYRISPEGAYTELASFNGDNGSQPTGQMIQASDGNFYGTTIFGGSDGLGTIFRLTPAGVLSTAYSFLQQSMPAGGDHPQGTLAQGRDGRLYGVTQNGGPTGVGTVFALSLDTNHPAFFIGESPLSNGVFYLQFPGGAPFGYYSYLSDPRYIFHQDLGYEFLFDANDGKGGLYFYDFKSQGFFYSSPSFGFPYLFDFSLNSVVYYYPDPNHAGRYNTGGVRYFYVFNTGQIISK